MNTLTKKVAYDRNIVRGNIGCTCDDLVAKQRVVSEDAVQVFSMEEQECRTLIQTARDT